MARLALSVRCPACGHEFDTGIRMDARDFARATFAANYHACPSCGHHGIYRKDDYRMGEPAQPPRHRAGAGNGAER